MIHSPTIINNTTPAVAVTSTGNLTYNQIQNNIGPCVYRIKQFFLQSTSLNQVAQIFTYIDSDASGNKVQWAQVPSLSPLQFKSTYYLKFRDGALLDGTSNLVFTLLANTTLIMIIEAEEFSSADYLKWQNNFEELQKAMREDFFD